MDILEIGYLGELEHLLARGGPWVVAGRVAGLDLGVGVALAVILCDPERALACRGGN